MKAIHFVARQQIEVTLDFVDCKKMPTHIEVHASPAETRTVYDLEGWKLSVGVLLKDLLQTNKCIVHARWVSSHNRQTTVYSLHTVGFGPQLRAHR
jgi:hypothetical protein